MNTASLPLTYPDIVCDLDVDPNASQTTSDLANLVQDVTHILAQDLGSNLDDPNRGVGIYRYLNGTTDNLQSLAKTIEGQLRDDPRITAISCTVNPTSTGDNQYQIIIQIQVAGQVLGLEYGYSLSSGLALISQAINPT